MEAAPLNSVHTGRRHAEQNKDRTVPARYVRGLCGLCVGTVWGR